MLFRKRGPIITGETSTEKFIRFVLLLCIFAGVGYAFWIQNGRMMESIKSRGTVWDEAHALTGDQKKALRRFGSSLQEIYGMKFRLHIRSNVVELPEPDGKTLFIGLNPETRQVLVDFPPLLRKALGEEYMYQLQNTHFGPYFERDEWQAGLAEALAKLWDDLGRS